MFRKYLFVYLIKLHSSILGCESFFPLRNLQRFLAWNGVWHFLMMHSSMILVKAASQPREHSRLITINEARWVHLLLVLQIGKQQMQGQEIACRFDNRCECESLVRRRRVCLSQQNFAGSSPDNCRIVLTFIVLTYHGAWSKLTTRISLRCITPQSSDGTACKKLWILEAGTPGRGSDDGGEDEDVEAASSEDEAIFEDENEAASEEV